MGGEALERASRVRLMLFDVDGVLTDGSLYFGESGEAMKGFHVRDGQGLKMLAESGVEVGLLSTRRSRIVEVRAKDLGIDLLRQGAADKGAAFGSLLAERGLAPEEAGYMGDDLVDLPVMARCGFAATVPEAPMAVRKLAHYVCAASGGRGAAREVCELILSSQGRLDAAVQRHLP